MKVTRVTFALCVALSMAACSTVEGLVAPTSEHKAALNGRDAAIDSLSRANSCCRDYSTLSYATANTGDDKWLPIDENSPVFNFSEGKSYFAAFKLPQNSGDLRITVAAEIGKTLYFPSVVLMDSQFKVTRVIDSKVFSYKEAQLLAGNRIEGVFTVDRTYIGNPNNETYIVIYTPENKLSETTTILSEAKLMARSTAVVDPGVKDPVIPHSPWGLLKLQIEDLSGDSGKDNMYKPAYQDAVDANTPKVDPTPNKLSIAPAAATAAVAAGATAATVNQNTAAPATTATPVASGSMLAETEQLYNQLIQKSVKDGDIEKAMAFAAEAERAGSRTAKPTLIDAIKHSQK